MKMLICGRVYALSLRNTALILSLLAYSACGRTMPPQSEFVLGTVCSINLFSRGTPKRYERLFRRLRELEKIFSVNLDHSELSGVNRRAGMGRVVVSPELKTVLEASFHYAEISGGALDPTVGPLVLLWGIGTERAHIPPTADIDAALSLTDYRELIIGEEGVSLKRQGMALDLGSMVKGYAADELVRLCREDGIKRCIIDLGGNIYALGGRKGAGKSLEPWRVGIQDPLGSRGDYLGILKVVDRSVVTSGVYERFFEEGERRYHHILSTKDGMPVENGFLSVTVIAERSIDADALSTALFALGRGKAEALLASLPGTEAIFVYSDKRIRLSPGAKAFFELRNEQYHLAWD
ncbi:MAG: FAD:protein FMN transferase [Treponema sp.]|jgi:thiamine biosynthesis lipoprotein|nr:FAD:protein FMN transferase [Treponema sp.]